MQNLNTILTPSDPLLTGLFKDYKNAEWAYQDLISKGYQKEEIHLLMSDEIREKYFPDTPDAKTGNETLKGIGIGASIGGGLGAIAAAVMAVGTSLAIPALGLVIAGPLAASLAGAGAGSITGGIVGALVGAGIPDEKAKIYEAGLKAGGIVIGVTPNSEADATLIESKWKEHQAETIFTSQ